jgi:hypothetical protein
MRSLSKTQGVDNSNLTQSISENKIVGENIQLSWWAYCKPNIKSRGRIERKITDQSHLWI